MLVRFIGPSAKRSIVFADGTSLTVSRGESFTVTDEDGRRMVEAGPPKMFEVDEAAAVAPSSPSKKPRMGKGEE